MQEINENLDLIFREIKKKKKRRNLIYNQQSAFFVLTQNKWHYSLSLELWREIETGYSNLYPQIITLQWIISPLVCHDWDFRILHNEKDIKARRAWMLFKVFLSTFNWRVNDSEWKLWLYQQSYASTPFCRKG